MSNSSNIFNEARAKLSSILGSTYREHTDLFEIENLSANSLDNGYSVVLLDAEEKSPQVNAIFLQRTMRVVLTHRTFASVNASKVIIKLEDVYNREAEVINEFRSWSDDTIGLIKALPSTKSKIEKFSGGEDSFLVNTIDFTILYKN